MFYRFLNKSAQESIEVPSIGINIKVGTPKRANHMHKRSNSNK